MKQESLALGCKCSKVCSGWLAVGVYPEGVRLAPVHRGGSIIILDRDDAKFLRDWLDGYLKESQPRG